jgi:hypothetical protein
MLDSFIELSSSEHRGVSTPLLALPDGSLYPILAGVERPDFSAFLVRRVFMDPVAAGTTARAVT